jgi:hypothetical protein
MRFILVFVVYSVSAFATTFTFNTPPFQGSTALTTPGRQIVGGEPSITFNIGTDLFQLDSAVFAVGANVLFANDVDTNLPTSGVNVIVLETFDNDGDATTAFGAGNAATLIASRLTSPGAGFFVYFNSGLQLARLVYSTDLNDGTADLQIIARMTNLAGASGRAALPTLSSANFQFVPATSTAIPEPSTMALGAAAGLAFTLLRFCNRAS